MDGRKTRDFWLMENRTEFDEFKSKMSFQLWEWELDVDFWSKFLHKTFHFSSIRFWGVALVCDFFRFII